MRPPLTAIALLALALPASAAPAPEPFRLPADDARAWAERVRKAVSRDGWTVSADGNDITLRREKPVPVFCDPPSGPAFAFPGKGRQPDGECRLRYVLRFSSRMPTAEYERLAGINVDSEKERDRLQHELGLRSGKSGYMGTGFDPEASLKQYEAAVAKLPRHDLPDLYTPDHSVRFFNTFGHFEHPADEKDAAEINDVEARLLRLFGVYDPTAAAEPRRLDRKLPAKD